MALRTAEELREYERTRAYESARGFIEGACLHADGAGLLGDRWYDLATADVELADELAYLDSRSLVELHPLNAAWVLIRDEHDPLPARAKGWVN